MVRASDRHSEGHIYPKLYQARLTDCNKITITCIIDLKHSLGLHPVKEIHKDRYEGRGKGGVPADFEPAPIG